MQTKKLQHVPNNTIKQGTIVENYIIKSETDKADLVRVHLKNAGNKSLRKCSTMSSQKEVDHMMETRCRTRNK